MAFGVVFFAGFFSALFFDVVDGLAVSAVVPGGVAFVGVVAVGAAVAAGAAGAAGAAVVAGGVVCASAIGVCEMRASVAAAASKYDLCIRTSNMIDPQ